MVRCLQLLFLFMSYLKIIYPTFVMLKYFYFRERDWGFLAEFDPKVGIDLTCFYKVCSVI